MGASVGICDRAIRSRLAGWQCAQTAERMAVAVAAVPTPLSTTLLLPSASRWTSYVCSFMVSCHKHYRHQKLVPPKPEDWLKDIHVPMFTLPVPDVCVCKSSLITEKGSHFYRLLALTDSRQAMAMHITAKAHTHHTSLWYCCSNTSLYSLAYKFDFWTF